MSNTTTTKARELKPKVQFSRKLGQLWQVFFGYPGRGHYGYGITRKQAGDKARTAFRQAEGRAK